MIDKTVLIIRPGALGDTILTLPLVASIQEQNPDALITFLGNRSCKDLLPANVEFQAFDDPGWLWLFNAQSVKPPDTARAYARAYVIAGKAEEMVRNLRHAGAGSVMHCPSSPMPGKHVVEHLHEALGLPIPPRTLVLARLAPAEKKDVIWVHPGSGGPGKCLPLPVMHNMAKRLMDQTGWSLGVTAGEEDRFLEETAIWKRLIQADAELVLIRRPLTEVCTELGAARLFLGNDSGIAHLAAALGVPSAVFFVKSDPLSWGPWVPDDRTHIIDLRGEDLENLDIKAHVSCMERLLAR